MLLAHLISLTTEKGASLSSDELRAASAAFQEFQEVFLDQSIDDVWRSCVQSVEAARWRNVRKFHLDRLLVQSFSNLFPHNDEPTVQGRQLSRRTIPGFLAGVQQMLGDDLHVQLDQRAEKLVESATDPLTGLVPWESVYENPAGALIVQDVLVFASRFFSDMAKRRNWMIDIVDSHMPPSQNAQEKTWNFGDSDFHLLMNAIYEPLRNQMTDEDGRLSLALRYSRADLDTVNILFSGLDQDFQRLKSTGAI